jgi:hypothetical protein
VSALTDTAPLLAVARALVIKNRRGSISLVQRYLRIGYNAATELLEMLQRDGVVGPINGEGGRTVLVTQLTQADVSALQSHGLMESGVTGTDGSQKPNDATVIPRAKAGSKKDADIARLRAANAALTEALKDAHELLSAGFPDSASIRLESALAALEG